MDMIPCPRCKNPVDSASRWCPQCGVDLAQAAVLEERYLTTSTAELPQGIISPEILVPRLGEYLIERGVLSPEDLQYALNYHRQLADSGKKRLLGQVLLELGYVDRETLDQVITEQILQLQSALQHANRQLELRVQERTRELQQALNRLSELNQLKSNFISNVSHELRTPLTHIKGYLDLLADGSLGPLTDQQTTAVEVALRSETRLEELIEELIQFTVAASGQFTIKLERVKLGQLIPKVVAQSVEKARRRGVKLEARVMPEIARVNADREKLTWVIMELIDNAIKFTHQDGRVIVEAVSEEGMVVVSVTDTGIGISRERLAEIFEPFHQLDGSTTRRYGGVGLGLALVKKIIEAHGSRIEASSDEGKGSRFEFKLVQVERDYD